MSSKLKNPKNRFLQLFVTQELYCVWQICYIVNQTTYKVKTFHKFEGRLNEKVHPKENSIGDKRNTNRSK